MKHITDSVSAKKFFAQAGIEIVEEDSALNSVTLKNKVTGETLELVAESDRAIAYGIPGIYVNWKGFPKETK